MVKNIKKLGQAIRTAKSVLFADPKRLYLKEKHLLNQPFHFPGKNGKAVLLIHGWTSTPYEVRRLGKFLNERGFTAYAPQLRGHGTVPKDLENVGREEWLEDVRKAYAELSKNHQKVFVAGTSIGATLAMMFSREEKKISGLVLMAAPHKIKWEAITVLLARIFGFFRKYNKKFYPPIFGVSTTLTRLISYQSYPVKSALETFDLIRESRKFLGEITQPCFLLQSSSDHIVEKNSMEKIYSKISSKIKKKRYIQRAYHTFICDIKNEHVLEEILEFLEEN